MSPELIGEVLAQNLTTRHCPGQLRLIYWRLSRLLNAADALREKAAPRLEEAAQAGLQ